MLQELGVMHQTDKSINKCYQRTYLEVYEDYFKMYQESATDVLELGVAAGGSLRTWKSYFYNATIYGIDVNPECTTRIESHIKIEIGSQDDENVLNKLLGDRKLDIVVDDGSHITKLMINSFNILFPRVKPGGFYCIEDTGLFYDYDIAYLTKVGGWPGMRFNRPDVVHENKRIDMMAFVDQVLDKLDNKDVFEFIHFYPRMVVMRKI